MPSVDFMTPRDDARVTTSNLTGGTGKLPVARFRKEAGMSAKGGMTRIGGGFGLNLVGLLIVLVVLGVSAAVALATLGGKSNGIPPQDTVGTVAGSTGGTTSVTAGGSTTTTTGGISAGIPAASAIAACQADASTVESALRTYETLHGGPSAAVTQADLTSGPSPLLQAFPSSPDYAISIVSGVVMIAAPKTAPPVAYGAPGACAKAGP
jgi:hypothetical protein